MASMDNGLANIAAIQQAQNQSGSDLIKQIQGSRMARPGAGTAGSGGQAAGQATPSTQAQQPNFLQKLGGGLSGIAGGMGA